LKAAVRATEGYDAQAALLVPVQRHGGKGDTSGVHAAAAHGLSGSGGALPHGGTIQQAFGGYDISNVTAHTDGAASQGAAAMGADAYATGSSIAFKGAPDLHTAAHEAAHVVQQEAGVSLSGGVGKVGDSYERHADKVADAVVAGKSAEPILSEMAGGGGGGSVQQKAVQRVEDPKKTPPITTPKDTPALETPTPTVTPLTVGESNTYARQLEVGFGASAASSGEALAGAQGLVDGAMRVLQASVDAWNQRLVAAQLEGERLEERVKAVGAVEAAAAEAMGTKAVSHAGFSNKSIAGAVAPSRVMAHLREGTGNLRTKMTAAFNFMGALSTVVLAEKRSGDGTFFKSLGDQGVLLMQAATVADVKIAEQKRKALEEKKDPKRVRESIVTPAASKVARQQDADREKKAGLDESQGHIGTAQDPFKSARHTDDASIGPELHADEMAFMGLESSALGEQFLTWREGLDLYTMNQDNEWVRMAAEIGLPTGAGPASGTTDRLMQTGAHLGCAPLATRAGTIGYLMSINAHTLNEIMTSAKPYGFSEPIDGFAMYKNIAPFGSLEGFDKSPDKRFWKEKVLGAAPESTVVSTVVPPIGGAGV